MFTRPGNTLYGGFLTPPKSSKLLDHDKKYKSSYGDDWAKPHGLGNPHILLLVGGFKYFFISHNMWDNPSH